MNVDIHLENSYFPWTKIDENNLKCWQRGDLYYKNNQLQVPETLSLFHSLTCHLKNYSNQLKDLFFHFNGSFSLVIETPDSILCVVDCNRSIPLFYAKTDSQFIISDDANYIRDQIRPQFNEKNGAEFLVTGYVTGRETLFDGIFQIQAGEFMSYSKNNNQITSFFYYEFCHEDYFSDSEKELLQRLDEVFVHVFQRLIASTKGKGLQIVVPLSGGLDSRLIVAMLKRLGVDDVICFSYGQKGNYEAEISKKVAEALGYQWYFVEYTHKKWYQCYHSDEASEFKRYSGNLSSLPHFQDFLAVQELQKEGKIPKKSVFIPGHCGNLIAVYCLPRKILEISPDFDHFVTCYWKEHYSLWPWDELEQGEELKNIFRKKIQKSVGNIDIHDAKSVANAIEFFNGYERQAKFIVNSVRVYEYFGYAWRIPIVDRELNDFFLKVPLQYRMRDDENYLYMQYAKNVLFIEDLKKLQDIDCTTKITCNLAYLSKKKCEDTINDNKILEILWLKFYYLKKKLLAYDSNPYYGMIKKEKFLKLYSGKQTINSFLALDYLEKFIPSPFDLLKINNTAKISLDFEEYRVNPSNYGDDESPQRSIVSLKCRDLAMDCSFKAKGTTEREIIRQIIEHIESAYNIPVLTADVLFRIKKGIKKY